jgi:hypothetical protein
MVRKSRAGYAMIPALSLVVAMPFYLAFVWAPGWPLALALLTVVMVSTISTSRPRSRWCRRK